MALQRLTLVGSDALEATIWATLESLASDAGHASDVDAVLLGGSLGRGEGTVIGDRLASDIELYIVGRGRGLRSHAARVEQAWRSRGHDVSVAWLHPTMLEGSRAKNLSQRPSRTIRLYELGASAMVLGGARPAMAELDPTHLPVAEGVRLILNRLAEAGPLITRTSDDLPRWLDKILIAAGDTLLLLAGRYTTRYRDRLDSLATVELSLASPSDLATIRAAYRRKLWGGGEAASSLDAARIAEAVLRRGLHESVGDSFGTDWSRFPAAFVRRAAHDEAYLRYLPAVGPAGMYESVIVVLRARRAGLRLGPAAFWNCVRGRPLSLLTQACAAPIGLALLDSRVGDMRAGAAAMVAGGIPISTSDLQSPSKVADTLRRYWSVTA